MITTHGLEQLGFDPSKDFILSDEGNGVFIKEWNSALPQPTETEIEAAHVAWEAEYAANQYKRDRAAHYPSIGDQLDMIYWDLKNGTQTFVDHIDMVKQTFPKNPVKPGA